MEKKEQKDQESAGWDDEGYTDDYEEDFDDLDDLNDEYGGKLKSANPGKPKGDHTDQRHKKKQHHRDAKLRYWRKHRDDF